MTQTVYGVALDALGHASAGGRYWSTPSALLRSVQDPRITVDLEHGRECGHVVYIERRHGNVIIVAEVDDTVAPETLVRVYPPPATVPHHVTNPEPELRSVPTDYFWSVSRFGDEELGFMLTGVALTRAPARITARPVVFRAGDAHMAAFKSADHFEHELLTRAHEYDLKRHGAPLVVIDDDPALLDQAAPSSFASRSAPIEYRSAVEVGDVDTSTRTIDVIVMPYESATTVMHKGRRVHELVARGAFDTIDRTGGRVRVNLDHNPARPVGRATAFDPDHADGLWARLKIAKTRDGDETLELAREDVLDVSAGFGVHEGGESWPSRNVRLLTRVFLDHVAMVSNPAYSDARVLAVRDRELAGVR